ncbi:hypothetical protein FisN_30Lu121 [Fistulifera solaris]|uniref:Uncharacterized protein n=1 Tax=Fistulifera solaris TaxID=1519565 RepID=A0A1Z5JJ60_FISSO|nr:hypothetical protein FisN_30Lu121 [Fistulifera solaris]|eukprot:GAX13801.1 hypothetical protein FisN_30Lu121 [Fistulifera solaris]
MRLYSVKSCTPVLVTAKAPSAANSFATQPMELQSTTFYHTTKHHLNDEQHATVTHSTMKASRTVVEPPSALTTHDDVSTLSSSSSSSTTTTTTLHEATWETTMDATTDDIIPECIVLPAVRNERLECSSFSWDRPVLVFTEETEDENWTAAPTTISSDEEEIEMDHRSSFLHDNDEWVTFSGFPCFIDTFVYQDTVSL